MKLRLLALFALATCIVMISAYTTAEAGPPEKVAVCHVDPDFCEGVEEGEDCPEPNPHVVIISSPAVPAHLGHGDNVIEEEVPPPAGTPCEPTVILE